MTAGSSLGATLRALTGALLINGVLFSLLPLLSLQGETKPSTRLEDETTATAVVSLKPSSRASSRGNATSPAPELRRQAEASEPDETRQMKTASPYEPAPAPLKPTVLLATMVIEAARERLTTPPAPDVNDDEPMASPAEDASALTDPTDGTSATPLADDVPLPEPMTDDEGGVSHAESVAERAVARSTTTGPVKIRHVAPIYPAYARRRGLSGSVTARLLVDTSGRVARVLVVSHTGHRSFRSAAVQAMRRWRFRPATENGHPVEIWCEQVVRFALEDGR